MKIDKFKKLSNNRYKIFFEDGNKIETYDDIIIKYNLLYKKELANDLIEKIIEENNYYEMYNKCLNLISNKMRSTKEIKDYLIKNDMSDDDIYKIIIKLTEIGLLNDEMYVKAYISDKINFTNYGPLKIKNDLLNLEIDYDIINEEVAKIDENILRDRIFKYIDKKSKTNKKSKYFFKEKMLSDLIEKGYDKEMILEYLEDIKIKSNIEDEYKKVYSKLSRKYEGEELKRNIKNKLYQKGYTKDEIESVID